MSVQAALEFREYLKANPEAQERARDIIRKIGRVDNVALAREYGFHFNEEEAFRAWTEVSNTGQLTAFEVEMMSLGTSATVDALPAPANDDDELTDLELEMVSGGGKYPCNTDQARFEGDLANRSVDGTNGG